LKLRCTAWRVRVPAGTGCGRRALAAGLFVLLHALAAAADADLPRARQLLADGQYAQAYQLLQPLQATTRDDAAFNRLLGEAALRTGRADEARALFAAALALQPDAIEAHLGLGRAYLTLGDYARAKIEFETVLRFDDLPPDLQTQAEIYAEAARA
jgi:predicted Zn-dependent protease